MSPSVIILGLVTAQRLGELLLARSNAERLLAAGAREVGARHYPLLVITHVVWLAGLWLLAARQPVSLPWLAVFILLQAARIWVIATLGRRWTTRIIAPREGGIVRTGPYRFLRHPNYAVVAGEIAVLPLVFGLPLYAALFSAINAGVLLVRIRAEDRALAATASEDADRGAETSSPL